MDVFRCGWWVVWVVWVLAGVGEGVAGIPGVAATRPADQKQVLIRDPLTAWPRDSTFVSTHLYTLSTPSRPTTPTKMPQHICQAFPHHATHHHLTKPASAFVHICKQFPYHITLGPTSFLTCTFQTHQTFLPPFTTFLSQVSVPLHLLSRLTTSS